MAIRNSKPIHWSPTSLSDARDGTNAPRGAMRVLQNLIPDTQTRGVWVCRQPAVGLTNFTGGPLNPGRMSCLLVVGNLAFGLVPSARFSGHDEPFVYDLQAGAFLPIQGVTSSNTPLTAPPSSTVPPAIIAQVGTRVIVCHPGFTFDPNNKFGWFDISSAALSSTGNFIAGDRYLRGKPSLDGVQPGMFLVSTPGIVSGTTVTSTQPYFYGRDFSGTSHMTNVIDGISATDIAALAVGLGVFGPGIQNGSTIQSVGASSINLTFPTTSAVVGTFEAYGVPVAGTIKGDTHTNTTVDNLTFTASIAIGQNISGSGIPANTTIANIVGTTITLSQAATATATGVTLTIGGNVIKMSAAAASTATGQLFLTRGGTRAAPLWGAGDMDRFPLPSLPLGVAQFNGRGYYAMGLDGIIYSDSLLACRMSNTVAVQALTTNDGLSVTAVAPLMLSTISGGIVQSVIAFEGIEKMQQITGDQSDSTLKMNALPVSDGTNSPLSIVPTRVGLAFMSPQGLRFVKFDGTVSDPIGDQGQGMTSVFEYAVSPESICAAENNSVLRISLSTNVSPSGAPPPSPREEYWYDIDHRQWSGPHTFPATLIQPWAGTFVLAAWNINGVLWQSDSTPSPSPPNSTFATENGVALAWMAETVPLPDNGGMAMNAMVEASLMVAGSQNPIAVAALDEVDEILSSVSLLPVSSTQNAGNLKMQQRSLDWSEPVIFKQMRIRCSGYSDPTVKLGNLYMRYEILGYNVGLAGGIFILDEAGNQHIVADDGTTPLVPA